MKKRHKTILQIILIHCSKATIYTCSKRLILCQQLLVPYVQNSWGIGKNFIRFDDYSPHHTLTEEHFGGKLHFLFSESGQNYILM